ncbi:hypothetical protein [uncultured Campylobacter sp.]
MSTDTLFIYCSGCMITQKAMTTRQTNAKKIETFI